MPRMDIGAELRQGAASGVDEDRGELDDLLQVHACILLARRLEVDDHELVEFGAEHAGTSRRVSSAAARADRELVARGG